MSENDSAHIKGLLETVEGAVILAHSVFFQNLVCDAKIVAATLKAAKLYGFDHPTELEGKFTSQLDHPDDYYMIKMITIYSIRYIRKKVKQIGYEGNIYWITTSEEVEPEQAIPLPDYRHLLTPEAIQTWFSRVVPQ
ncbi:hypothetical protein C2W62_35950 [Candidatus Entotheonella serta]|nr:hypothetical protein C2W62_35950 [Candidatus Entotheonella serta]